MITEIVSIGLMSGTSMDGIDAAMIRTDGLSMIEEIGTASLNYEKPFHYALKAAEFAVRQSQGNLTKAEGNFEFFAQTYLRDELNLSSESYSLVIDQIRNYFDLTDTYFPTLARIIEHSTELHGELVTTLIAQQKIRPDVVGYHGQNLYHAPGQGMTVQVGDGQLLADITGIPVVYDFRKNDVLNGGQGAPFAPIYHQALAARGNLAPLVIVNCGGIANVTFIFGTEDDALMGFDTGPGNGLIDLYIKKKTQGMQTFDKDGVYGLRGTASPHVENLLWTSLQAYLEKSPPKSLDIADFSLHPALETLSMEDAVRTLESFTARTIVNAINFIPKGKTPPQTWVLAGGGWKNPVILSEFKDQLKQWIPGVKILLAHEVGFDSQGMEAQIFAFLAVRSMKGLPLSLPQTTGVQKPMAGGVYVVPSSSPSNNAGVGTS